MVSERRRLGWGTRGALACALTAAVLTAARARETPVLQKAKPQRATVAQRYSLPLAQRDCALGALKALAWKGAKPASGLQLIVIDPATNKPLRHFRIGEGSDGEFGFCVEAAGTYTVEVGPAAAGGYELTLDAVLARKPLAQPPPITSPPMSPRLRALAEQLDDPAQLEKFWAQTKHTGTPLIEPSELMDSSWVTFLYRGPATRAVSVSWPMWTFALENTALARLPGTNLWWKSVQLPNSARFSYQLVIDPPQLSAANTALTERARDAVTQVDPNNRTLLTRDPSLDAYAQRSVVQLPAAEPERWLEAKAQRRGRVEARTLASQKLGHAHALSAYLPADYDKDKTGRYPLLIFFDGGTYLNDVPTPQLLDALIAAHAIVPIIALFVHDDTPSQRANELPCNPRFAAFVAEELLPYARSQLRITDERAQIGLAGASFGGLASSFIVLQYPEQFGKVLSQSGSYWWSFPAGHPQFDGSDKPGWLRRRFTQRPPAAIQFYLSAGTFEGAPDAQGVLDQTRLQRDALRAQGYSVAYQEFMGGHDHLAWRATLPDGLIALYAPDH